MSPRDRSDGRLGASLRAALASAEPARVPPFGVLWHRAQRLAVAADASAELAPLASGRLGSRRPAWALAAAFALLAVGLLQWDRQREARSRIQAADYALALQVAAANGFAVPSDRWLASGPASLLRGAPQLPTIEYPLFPKESFL